MRHRLLLLLSVLPLLAPRAGADPHAIPPETFPAPFGVNIHYTRGETGETAQLASAYRVARMDFSWNGTERVRGEYDWSAYDGLLRELEANHVTPLFILDYGNDLYQEGPPRTPEAVSAYARWAAAAAAHYKGRKIMWEFWNEPNGSGFWGGRPDPEEYARLVNEAAPAMRKSDPRCTLLVCATSGFPWDYLDTVMKRGVLRLADAVTVHPYRSGMPETVTPDYARLRRMIARYAPGRQIPILSGEWGYSTNTKTGIPELRQAQYLVRQRLVNVAQGVRTSIWYDWKNDGPDAQENEHRFGSVTQDRKPKPSFTAARTMTSTLSGYRFVRMLVDKPDEYVMLFRNAKGELALALWTTGPVRRYRVDSPMRRIVEMDGRVAAGSGGSSTVLTFGPSPRYALLGKSAALDARTTWWWMRPHTVVEAGKDIVTPGITIRNTTGAYRRYTVTVSVDGGTATLPRWKSVGLTPGNEGGIPVTIRIMRRAPETHLRVTVRSRSAKGDTLTDTATIPLTVANPLTVTVGPESGAGVDIALETPMVRAEDLTVKLTDVRGLTGARPATVSLKKGQERTVARVQVDSAEAAYTYGVRVTDASGAVVAEAPPVRFQRFLEIEDPNADGTVEGIAIHPEGDEKRGGSATLRAVFDEERQVVADIRAEFPDGWRYFVVTPVKTGIPADAVAIGMWVKGDNSGDAIRVRFVDAKGQTYQPTYGNIDWTGWRWITMPLTDPTVGSWGGPQDGVIHRPIRWDSVFLLDSASQRAHTGHVQFDDVTVITGAH